MLKLVSPVLVVWASLFLVSPQVSAQAVWKGVQYNNRVCTSPNCRMCNSIQSQLSYTQQPVQVVQQAVQAVQYRTEMRQVTRRVKMCNGKTCWYENVTTMEPVQVQVGTERQPVQAPTPEPAVFNSLTNTELAPTPQAAVEQLLELLKPSSKSYLFDIGCGDGRILVTAAKHYGCTAVGIELNPESAELARKNAVAEFVRPLVTVFEGDARNYDLTDADFAVMYLYPELMEVLVPRLRKGTVVASYLHKIPGMSAEKHSFGDHTFYVGVK